MKFYEKSYGALKVEQMFQEYVDELGQQIDPCILGHFEDLLEAIYHIGYLDGIGFSRKIEEHWIDKIFENKQHKEECEVIT